VTIHFEQAAHFAYQAEAMFEYGATLEYSREMLRLADSRLDSLLALSQLSRTAFFAGQYYGAAEYQVAYLGLNDSLAGDWLKLAGYQMMNGEYDDAAVTLERGSALDPANNIIIFNRGLRALYTGDTAQAKVLFNEVLKSDSPEARLESQLTLAELLHFSDNEQDRRSAEAFCREAVAALSNQEQRHNSSSAQAMWLGIAFLGIDDSGNADDLLRTALYLETRPFYEGLIYLWLGKVADIRGERSLAKDYYSRVLSGASARYHQEEARRWLQTAYRR
jgi:tetratricopeptide (TPR) repeat protein